MAIKKLRRAVRAVMVATFMAVAAFTADADLVVRDFRMLPTDQTAINSETMKKDQNGRTAALIKIYTSLNEEQTYFDNGVLGIVARENKPGQIWLYIPARSQSIMINNKNYPPLRYFFEEEIQQGKTYSMQLTPEGKVVNLVASVRHAPIYVDEDSVGVSPHEIYLGYGEHAVRAQQGMMIYQGKINVTPEGPTRFDLPMEDESKKYSDVTVTVPGNADIYFEGNKVGVGEWSKRLFQGSYSVEVKKENCENQIVNFLAVGGKPTFVECPAPVPFRGYLTVDISPNTGAKVYDGDTIVAEHRLSKLLNVGKYTYEFRRKGYEPVTRTFSVIRNEETTDTVVMQRIQYISPNSMYLDLGFTYGTIPGVTARLGGYFKNIGLEAGYTMGLGKSDEVYWYEGTPGGGGVYDNHCTYKMDVMTIKAGYQLSFVNRIGVTPQLGYVGQRLKGGLHANGSMCHNLSIGARVVFKPVKWFGFFLAPEYAIPVSVNETYKNISEQGGFSKGGFYATAGLTFSFF